MAEQGQGKHIRDVLRDMPTNWGRWGKDDELGSINFLTPQEVARGARAVRSGKTFASLSSTLARMSSSLIIELQL